MSDAHYYTDFADEETLDSTAFRSAWYDSYLHRLFVEWYNGTISARSGVCRKEWEAFIDPNTSSGRFWYLNFKEGKKAIEGNLDNDHFVWREKAIIAPNEVRESLGLDPVEQTEFVLTFEVVVRSTGDFQRAYAKAAELLESFGDDGDVEIVGMRKKK